MRLAPLILRARGDFGGAFAMDAQGKTISWPKKTFLVCNFSLFSSPDLLPPRGHFVRLALTGHKRGLRLRRRQRVHSLRRTFTQHGGKEGRFNSMSVQISQIRRPFSGRRPRSGGRRRPDLHLQPRQPRLPRPRPQQRRPAPGAVHERKLHGAEPVVTALRIFLICFPSF